MTENEPYTPTTQQVRDAVLMSGKPFDQIVEIDDPVEGYSIHDQYVEPGAAFARWLTQHDAEVLTAARPSWEAESREALAQGLTEARWPEHAGGGLFDVDEETVGWLADALIASGVVTVGEVVTLATPAETDERVELVIERYGEYLRQARPSYGIPAPTTEEPITILHDAIALLREGFVPRPVPVASQGDTPEGEEWEDPEPWLVVGDGFETRHAHEWDNETRYGAIHEPRTREQYEADLPPAVPVDAEHEKRVAAILSARETVRRMREVPVDERGFPTQESEEMVYVGTPDGSGGYEIPARELDAILRSKNVPVDALGFPTEVGATFRARFAGNPEDYTPHHFRVSEPGRFWLYSVGNYRRYHLNPASIEDVRPADGRNGQ